MFQNKNLSVLESNLLFKGVDESVITPIFNSKNFRAEKEGELIFQAGEESSFLYLILQGEVKLKYSGTKGSNASFRRSKNEFFGEQEVIEKTNRITSAVADTDCIFYLVSKEELFQLISKNRGILNNLSFSPQEENYEEENLLTETEQEQNADTEAKNEERTIEEIIMDEDLADYSFDTPANEELHDFHNENYLSYDHKEQEEDLNFNNNGNNNHNNEFEPEINNLENANEEILENHFQNEESTDKLPDYPETYFQNNGSSQEEHFIPAINDFENIPNETEKFDFKNEYFKMPEQTFKIQVQETETMSLTEGASKFVNNNILFPLNEIKRLSDFLTNNSSHQDASKVNELIKRHSDSIQSIVDSAFDLLSGVKNQNLTKQNIKTSLGNILNLLSEYVETRNINLYKKIDTDAEVLIDETKLYNAFFQLAKNACDSMPAGGNIFVSVLKEDDKVKIEFIDEGIGIPSSVTFEVFEPMVTHGKQDAPGLGLTIARKIIQDHNGDISVDGELGEGTRFVITLPVNI
ncbi:MAG TPA: ATP-binding protein [Ignavibacteriaceae bacterium]|nr:ATP-binding protein [Ignavibacteriaceae bacterium]